MRCMENFILNTCWLHDFSSTNHVIQSDLGYPEFEMSARSSRYIRFLTMADRLVPIIFAPHLNLKLAGKQIFKFEDHFPAILFPIACYVYNLNFSQLSYLVHQLFWFK